MKIFKLHMDTKKYVKCTEIISDNFWYTIYYKMYIIKLYFPSTSIRIFLEKNNNTILSEIKGISSIEITNKKCNGLYCKNGNIFHIDLDDIMEMPEEEIFQLTIENERDIDYIKTKTMYNDLKNILKNELPHLYPIFF